MERVPERFPPGTLLDGRYRVQRKLGVGGMAEVFLVRDESLDRDCALKIMRCGRNEDALQKRFRREFSSCSALTHPNVLRLYELGSLDEELLYYTMEHLPFADLHAVLGRNGPLEVGLVLDLGGQILSALEAIHGAGLVHRDLKPSNLILTREGRLVVMDFGLVRDEKLTVMTRTGQVLGTPRYAAPEQLRGKRVDGRADLFAVGVILHFFLSNEMAFPGKDIAQVAHAVMMRPSRRLAEDRSDLSPSWQLFLDGLLMKDPDERYGSAAEAREDLERLGRNEALRGPQGRSMAAQDASFVLSASGANPPSPEGEPVTKPMAAPCPEGEGPPPEHAPPGQAGAGRRSVAVGVLLLLLGLIMGLGWFWRGRSPSLDGSYSIRKFHVEPGVEGFEIRWESDEAYPSRLAELLPPGGRIEGEGSAALRSHRLEVTGLEEGRRYSFRILFPSGRKSLPKTVTTRRFTVEDLGVLPGPEGPRLRLRIPGADRVSLTARGQLTRVEDRAALSEGGDRWSMVLPRDPTLREFGLSLHFRGGGARRFELGSWLDQRTELLLKRLEGFEVLPLAMDVLQIMSPKFGTVLKRFVGTMQQAEWSRTLESKEDERARTLAGAARVRAMTKKRLAAMGFEPAYREALALAPLVFDTRLLSLDRRLAFHEAMRRWEAMHLYFAFRDAPLSEPPRPDMGRWGLWVGGEGGLWSETRIFEAVKKKDALRLGLVLPFKKRNCVTTFERKFRLGAPGAFKEAELVIEGDDIHKHIAQIEVNGSFAAWCYEKPLIPNRGARPLVQGLPPELLREGENVIRLSVEPFYDHMVDRIIVIRRLTLRRR